jgi:cytochrome c peroxidase
MTRFVRSLAPLLLAIPWYLTGCAGEGTETPSTSSVTSMPNSSSPNGVPSAQPAAPAVALDRSVLATAVKEDTSAADETPKNYLWLPAEGPPPTDEPLAVAVPTGLVALTPKVVVPAANPLTKAKYELGKQLYFDPRVSKDGTVSCATCHNPEKGWTDNLPVSVGILGQKGKRSAPSSINTAYGKSMFWDGRAPSLEGQAQGPIRNPIEMGDQSFKEIVERLRAISGYQEQFHKVFGTDVTLDGLAKAVATFERTLLSGNSPYDRYSRGDMKALSESQKRGMVLFGLRLDNEDEYKPDVVLKKANCTSCHVGFNFTDEQFHNLGVGYNAKDGTFADLGRFGATPIGAKNPAEIGAFKTPTLRDMTRTAPYMHDGSEATLEQSVDFYDRGGNPNPYLDEDIKKLNLTAAEKADLVEFMKALTGDEVKVELPTLPVGPDGKSPDPRAALKAPSAGAALAEPHGVLVR